MKPETFFRWLYFFIVLITVYCGIRLFIFVYMTGLMTWGLMMLYFQEHGPADMLPKMIISLKIINWQIIIFFIGVGIIFINHIWKNRTGGQKDGIRKEEERKGRKERRRKHK